MTSNHLPALPRRHLLALAALRRPCLCPHPPTLCSTFKVLLAAAVLQRVERGQLASDQWVPYTRADITAHSPVTQQHLAAGGMPALALAEATQTTSDNAAANLLLRLCDRQATAQERAAGRSRAGGRGAGGLNSRHRHG